MEPIHGRLIPRLRHTIGPVCKLIRSPATHKRQQEICLAGQPSGSTSLVIYCVPLKWTLASFVAQLFRTLNLCPLTAYAAMGQRWEQLEMKKEEAMNGMLFLFQVLFKMMSIAEITWHWSQMNGWVWSNGGMVLTGENWSAGRKTLYSVSGRWMDAYGAMVEWYWQGKPEVLGEKHYTVWVVDGWMSMEQWWNDTDRGKLKYWEKNIIQRGW